MAEFGISEFILVAVAVIIGISIFSLTEAYIIPNYNFTTAVQQANSISESVFVSISPPGISDSGDSFLGYIYSPAYSGDFYVLAFCINSNELPSLSLDTPTTTPNPGIFTVSLISNGNNGPTLTPATKSTLSKVYDTNGQVLASSVQAYSVQAYSVPANTPFEIEGNFNPNGHVLVVWIIYYSSGYYFRITYTYTG